MKQELEVQSDSLRESAREDKTERDLPSEHRIRWLACNATLKYALFTVFFLALVGGVVAGVLLARRRDSSCVDHITGRHSLSQGNFLCSPNREFKFGLDIDGDLALFEGNRTIWSANTSSSSEEEVTAEFKASGDLVVWTTDSEKILWSSQTASMISNDTEPASLMVGDDGIVTITHPVIGHIWSSAIVNDGDHVIPGTLEAKVMAGYQGWFFAKGDGGMDRWVHWGKRGVVPDTDSVSIDFWPDLRDLDDDELYPTSFKYKDGSTAGLYSAYNTKTVERHTRWMKEYGIDGIFVQRFITAAMAWTPVVDKVLANVRSGAEKYGRVFVVMYDVGRRRRDRDSSKVTENIIDDWKHLIDDEHVTRSRQYLHHRGRPLVAIWGFGFKSRVGEPDQVATLIDWFKNRAEDKYKATIMGGVPAKWRNLSGASKSDEAWSSIYRSYDVINPWTVGRYTDIQTADDSRVSVMEPDLAECDSLGIDYLPVVFPGFSFNNANQEKSFNGIPRNGGTFMWHQMYNAVAAGSKMMYVAMFDEVDEATAIFKLVQNQDQTPTEGQFLTTGYDPGFSECPGDWYLNITGMAASFIRDGKEVPLNMPAYR